MRPNDILVVCIFVASVAGVPGEGPPSLRLKRNISANTISMAKNDIPLPDSESLNDPLAEGAKVVDKVPEVIKNNSNDSKRVLKGGSGNYSLSQQIERDKFQASLDEGSTNCFAKPLYTDNSTSGSWCPRVWDQLLCWQPTPPNTRVSLPCPEFVPGFIGNGSAWRRCGEGGIWESQGGPTNISSTKLTANNTQKSNYIGWTNYTPCVNKTLGVHMTHARDSTFEEWLPTIKQMSVVGYSVSLVTLVISFTILASLRKLRCPRNLLHLHLFASFMLRAVVVLLRSYLFTTGMTSLPPNFGQDGFQIMRDDSSESWFCKFMISVWQYFILANYSWLLMEGLYLHSLIFMALFTDSSAITLYILLGWGIPLGCVGLWVTLRATLDNKHCWTVNYVQWIFWLCIRAPVAVSNLINFFFFLNIVRVLVLKLRSSISAESMKYRKLGKSTLVLVPLFGVHYFVLWGLSTSTNIKVELAWLLLDQVFASFQGFFVAVLYCLMNGEVRQELRKLYNRWYKGDPLVLTSHSTQVSHTKTYVSSRGRTSIHSIYSQQDRRDPTPSPQMPRSCYMDGGNISRPRTASPSPTATLTPTYGSRQQSREMSMCQGSSESCEEAIELRSRTTSEGARSLKRNNGGESDGRNSSNATLFFPQSGLEDNNVWDGSQEGTAVEILIDLHDGNYSYKKDSCNEDGSKEAVDSDMKNSHPLASQNGQTNAKSKEKHLTFSESTEQLLNSKANPPQENGCLLTDRLSGAEEDAKEIMCVNVNQKSLKSTTPLQLESTIVKKNSKSKEQETML